MGVAVTAARADGEELAAGLAADRLPRSTRLLYSVSSLGAEALVQSRAAWLLYFYAPPADNGPLDWRADSP